MPGFLTPWPRQQVFDPNGDPLPGALLYTYLTGTDTETPVYADADLDTEHTNPVEADAGGLFPAIYLDPAIAYKFVLNDEDDELVWEEDPIQVTGQTGASITSNTTAQSTGSLTETTLATFTIPANTLVENGQAVMVRVWGAMEGVSAGDRQMYVKLNGTAYSQVGVDGASDIQFLSELQIMRTGANAQSIVNITYLGNTFATNTTAALTDTNAITVTVTAINGATASPVGASDMTFTGARVWLS